MNVLVFTTWSIFALLYDDEQTSEWKLKYCQTISAAKAKRSGTHGMKLIGLNFYFTITGNF